MLANEIGRVYEFRPGTRTIVAAQIVGEALDRIEQSGQDVTPSTVVDVARPDDAPLHPCFEWNDHKAAEEHRKAQARNLIRSVRVVVVPPEPGQETYTEPVYIHIKPPDSPPCYMTTSRVASNEEYVKQALAECLARIKSLRRDYRFLAELRPDVGRHFDEFIERFPA